MKPYYNQRSRGWCWTVNNYTDDDIVDVLYLQGHVQYLIVGFETAPTTGTPHMQCYCFFKHQKTGKSFSEFFRRDEIHVEKAKGSPEENRNYCLGLVKGKEPNDDCYEFGVVPISGRITMEHLETCMRNPEGNIQVFHQYRKTYDELLNIRRKNDTTKTKFFVINEFYFSDDSVFYPSLFDELSIETGGLEYSDALSRFIEKVAIVSELSELELYQKYDYVVLTQVLPSDYTRLRMWREHRLPIYYNYGYMKKIIRPLAVIFVTDNIRHKVFKGMEILDFGVKDIGECEPASCETTDCETPSLTENTSDTNN